MHMHAHGKEDARLLVIQNSLKKAHGKEEAIGIPYVSWQCRLGKLGQECSLEVSSS